MLSCINRSAFCTLRVGGKPCQQQGPHTKSQGVDCAVQLMGGRDTLQSNLHNIDISLLAMNKENQSNFALFPACDS